MKIFAIILVVLVVSFLVSVFVGTFIYKGENDK